MLISPIRRAALQALKQQNVLVRTYKTDSSGRKTSAKYLPHILTAGVVVLVGSTLYGIGSYFSPGRQYPKPVRKLLREGGMAYLRTSDKQDLPKAIECYTQALALLDQIGKDDPTYSRDAAYVTGLVARIASVYSDMGDIDSTISTYLDLLQRIVGDEGVEDPRSQVRQLLDDKLPLEKRKNILRALGCANKLAEAYEIRASQSKRRSALIAHPDRLDKADLQEARKWYQWCLHLVTLTYQNHYNHQMLAANKPPTSTPPFAPDTLPKYMSVEVVTSLFYNSASFFASHGQADLALPLLQRGLDLLRHGADGKETSVCRSAILMSHLANAAVATGDLPAAEQWSLRGLGLAKKFSANNDCLSSFVALTYDLGAVYERAGRTDSARVQYRQALMVANQIYDDEAANMAKAGLESLSS